MGSKRILSFGAGLQTTALAILVAQGKLEVDAVVFADTGAEKPETYWYMENYTEPILKEAKIPFLRVPGVHCKRNLIEHIEHYRTIPNTFKGRRWCTDKFKVSPILKAIPEDAIMLIGFSFDESHRKWNAKLEDRKQYPLIEMQLTAIDCMRIIQDYGFPKPIKSSCFFCPYQRWTEWNWLKQHHPELIEKAIELEKGFHTRRKDLRETHGFFGGKPLWKWRDGIQLDMPILQEYSCWSGYCGH